MGTLGGQSEDRFLRIKDIKKLPQFFPLAGALYDIYLTPTKGGLSLGRSHQPQRRLAGELHHLFKESLTFLESFVKHP